MSDLNLYSPHYDPDENRTIMGLDSGGSWVHVTRARELLSALEQAQGLFGHERDARLQEIRERQKAEIRAENAEKALAQAKADLKQLQDGLHARFLEWRGIDHETAPCEICAGSGVRSYPNSSGWRNRPAGQAVTSGVCDKCWGSGDPARPGANLRQLQDIAERQREADAAAVREHVKIQRFWMDEKGDDAPASAEMHQVEAIMAARIARAIRKAPLVTEEKKP